MEIKKFWKYILFGIVGPAILSISTGMILYKLQEKRPALVYIISESIPFLGDKENLSIYLLEIQNKGSKLVEEVSCQFHSSAIIKDRRIKNDGAIPCSDSYVDKAYSLQIPIFNPGESISISILVTSSQGDIEKPKITLRGKGVVGKVGKASEAEPIKTLWTLSGAFVVNIVSMIGVLFITIKKKRLASLILPNSLNSYLDESKHSDDQEKILAYLFGLKGNIDQMEYYLSKKEELSYWSESDRIATIAINATHENKTNAMKYMLIDLLEYAQISPSSRGIIHYNIARIEKFQKNQQECEKHINEARKSIPNLLATRLKLDPLFRDDV